MHTYTHQERASRYRQNLLYKKQNAPMDLPGGKTVAEPPSGSAVEVHRVDRACDARAARSIAPCCQNGTKRCRGRWRRRGDGRPRGDERRRRDGRRRRDMRRRDRRRRGAARVRARDACEGPCVQGACDGLSTSSEPHARKPEQREEVVDTGSGDPGSPEDLHLNRPRTKPGGALRKDHHACAEIRAYAERGSGQGRERAQELRRAASTSRWRGRS